MLGFFNHKRFISCATPLPSCYTKLNCEDRDFSTEIIILVIEKVIQNTVKGLDLEGEGRLEGL